MGEVIVRIWCFSQELRLKKIQALVLLVKVIILTHKKANLQSRIKEVDSSITKLFQSNHLQKWEATYFLVLILKILAHLILQKNP